MKTILFTLLLPLFANFSFSQIKEKDLEGKWFFGNASDQYYKSDTLIFIRSIDKLNSCDHIIWEKDRKNFKLTEVKNCIASNTISTQRIELKKEDFGSTITLYQDAQATDKFRILSLEKRSEKTLKLMRFDKLSEQKLYNYVDSLIFKVFDYQPSPPQEVIVRDLIDHNPEPLVIVNGYFLKDKELLKNILLAETYSIEFSKDAQLMNLYGNRARNGVIFLKTSKRKWEKVRKEVEVF